MFGMSLPEILIIAVIAVLFLGPDKLPEAMVQIAKFFKTVKKGVNDAKASFESEIKIAELKQDAQKYKQSLEEATSSVRKKLTFEELDEIKKNLNSGTEAINKGLNTVKDPLGMVKDELKNISKEQILTTKQNKSKLAQNGGRRAARIKELNEQEKVAFSSNNDEIQNLDKVSKPSTISKNSQNSVIIEPKAGKILKTTTEQTGKTQATIKPSKNSAARELEAGVNTLKKGVIDV